MGDLPNSTTWIEFRQQQRQTIWGTPTPLTLQTIPITYTIYANNRRLVVLPLQILTSRLMMSYQTLPIRQIGLN